MLKIYLSNCLKAIVISKMDHFAMHNLGSLFNNGRSKTVCPYCSKRKSFAKVIPPIRSCHQHLKGNLFLEVIKANKRQYK